MTRAYVITRVILRSCILCGEQEWNAAGDAQRELTEAEAVAERNARCARCGGSLAARWRSSSTCGVFGPSQKSTGTPTGHGEDGRATNCGHSARLSQRK